MTEELRPLADFARNLVVACGARLRERRRSISPAMREKGSYRDIVTDHDLWVQQYLAEALQKEAPFCGILGEEGARRQGDSPWTWVLDPIDGTTNYYQAGRGYAISLGLLYREEPVWGLVLEGSSGKAWRLHPLWGWAVRPRGSPPGSAPLRGKDHGVPYGPGRGRYRFARQFQGVRYFGCGGAQGFDTLAAQAVLAARRRHPQIRLILVLACPEQADRWPAAERARWRSALDACDLETMVQHNYDRFCMHRRDRYMVDRSQRIIAAYDGRTGGDHVHPDLRPAPGAGDRDPGSVTLCPASAVLPMPGIFCICKKLLTLPLFYLIEKTKS